MKAIISRVKTAVAPLLINSENPYSPEMQKIHRERWDAIETSGVAMSQPEILPPWLVYPEHDHFSAFWTSGKGYRYYQFVFVPFFTRLPDVEKLEYLDRYDLDAAWVKDWKAKLYIHYDWQVDYK